MNYKGLTSTQKQKIKPLLEAMRKLLYQEGLVDELNGLVVNFGKGSEERFTTQIKVIA